MKRTPSGKKPKPIVVRSGNVSVKVYRTLNRGRDLFTLAYRGTDGRRVRRNFADLKEAMAEAQAAAIRIQNGQIDALELTGSDRGLYLRALEVLKPTGKALDFASAEYAEATRIIAGAGSVIEAARYFARHHPVALPQRTAAEVYDEFLEARRADNVSKRYLEDIRSRLGRFSKRFPDRLSEVTTQQLEDWLADLGVGAVARNSTRSLIVTLFNFARQRGYLPKGQPTVAEGIPKAKELPTRHRDIHSK